MKTDSQLYTEIMEKLEFEPAIHPTHITLAVREGIVTLTGTVGHYPEKRKVERAVRGIEGVRGIVNDLAVNLIASLQRNDTDIAKTIIYALEWAINVPADKIKVTVENGHVKLTGEVEWAYQRHNAENAVRYLAGIKSIDNQIKIKPSMAIISPTEVKEKISKEFERNALIDAARIQVESRGGEIILKGHVRSWPEYREAERAAWSIPGVIQVNNHLSITN
ncbi:BON domain-containing protein [Legionella dresdenensis]|uniref:BON domain-containing protein n=1 Tax=Legionella dresdenensis TaxID=450200 RepID=A0ABV8CBA4_9GAMM